MTTVIDKLEQIKIIKLQHGQDLPLPSYATEQSAGMDLYAATSEDITLQPNQRLLIETGIAIALPQGYEAQVRPRSGLAVKFGITVLNSPGTIDADYRGEIKVLLINLGNEPYTIKRGDRIAQLIISTVNQISWQPVHNLDITERNKGGFGSTGS